MEQAGVEADQADAKTVGHPAVDLGEVAGTGVGVVEVLVRPDADAGAGQAGGDAALTHGAVVHRDAAPDVLAVDAEVGGDLRLDLRRAGRDQRQGQSGGQDEDQLVAVHVVPPGLRYLDLDVNQTTPAASPRTMVSRVMTAWLSSSA